VLYNAGVLPVLLTSRPSHRFADAPRARRTRAALLLLSLVGLGAVLTGTAHAQRAHEVGPGQTFAAIARRYHVSVWDLAFENRLTPTSNLRAGQTLTIPPRGMTYVRPGQTLSHVASAHGCSVEELQHINGLRNSAQVRAGSRIKLPGFMRELRETALDRDWGEPEAPGFVRLLSRTGSAVEVEMVDRDGRVRLKGLRALAELMRRHEDDPAQSAHPRLAVLLSKISDHFGGREIRVVSGFRDARGNTRETSRHTQGRAADIQVAGVSRLAVFEYCRSLVQTGCGLYPKSGFVHVDVREHHAQWVDWSSAGRKPRYGTLTRAYRRRERAQPNRPRVGRRVTRPDELPLIVEVVNRTNTVVRVADERVVDEAPADSLFGAVAGTAHADAVGEP